MNRLPHEIHITGEMRLAGPLTQEKLLDSAYQPWHGFEEKKKIKLDLLTTLETLVQRGTVFLWEQDGRYYLKPKSAGAGPVPEPVEVQPVEGEEMAKKAAEPVAEKPKRGRPAKNKPEEENGKAAPKPSKAEKAESNGDDEDGDHPAPDKYKDLETDGEVSDAMAIAENEAAKAKSELEVKMAVRRIACAKRDFAIIMREHLKISEGASVDDIRAAQKEVDKAEKVVVKASAERREAQAAYDSVNERISQILLRRLPLFD